LSIECRVCSNLCKKQTPLRSAKNISMDTRALLK
jgi:hypothetical protein